jgi:hypothetical protein
MSPRSLLVLFASFLAVISGASIAHAQSATPSFTLSASSTTLPTSGQGAIAFTITSVNGFAGMVAVGCGPTNPPTGSVLPQCNYAGSPIPPSPYTLTANGTVTGSVNLVSYIPPCSNPCPVKFVQPQRHRTGVNLALASVLFLGFAFVRRGRRLGLLLMVLGISAGLACGSGSHTTLTPGTFAYSVSATEVETNNTPVPIVTTTVNVTVPAGISTNLPSANP